MNDSSNPPLAVIGDSHSLTYDGTRVTIDEAAHTAQARLIMGCKAWHLGNEQRNRFDCHRPLAAQRSTYT